jgi:hypothetical protein
MAPGFYSEPHDMPSDYHSLQTTPEILAFLHAYHLPKREEKPFVVEFDCVVQAGIYRSLDRDKEQNECTATFLTIWFELSPDFLCRWSDAAYEGRWDDLFRIALRSKWDFGIGRYANSFPLCASETEAGIGNEPARKHHYAALHQAVWHGAPVEIVQGLIDLGASRRFVTLSSFSTHVLLYAM